MGNGDIHLYRNCLAKNFGHLFRIKGLSRLEMSMKGVKEVMVTDDLRWCRKWCLCSNDDTPCVLPGSPSFCIWHRPPPRLIGFRFVFFGVFWFGNWPSGIIWRCSQTWCRYRRMEIGWNLIGRWSMWRERWKHWRRVDRNRHPRSRSCCGMRIEKRSRWWLTRRMNGRSWRTWTRAV